MYVCAMIYAVMAKKVLAFKFANHDKDIALFCSFKDGESD